MKISSNRNSACRECKKEWKTGEQIHYDPDTRATCVDEKCFETQVRKRIEERNERNSHATNNENKANLPNEFKLENEDEFRNKIHEKLAKYKIIMEESEKFLDDNCKDDNDRSKVKTSVELILRDLL
jgi:hypothetical protein